MNLPFRVVPLLHEFLDLDWPRFERFWIRGIWRYLPFVVVSKKRLRNMHWDVADHSLWPMKSGIKEWERHRKSLEQPRSDEGK